MSGLISTRAALLRLEKTWTALPPNTRGALWMLVSAVFFSGMAFLIKVLGQKLDVSVVTFFRALFGLLTVLPFALRLGADGVKTKRLPLHLFRATIGAGAMSCGFYALTKIPMADAVAISFTRPLFLIVLAVIFLGEVVRIRRWSATFVGFIGVVVMVRPSVDIEAASIIALVGTFLVAVAVVCVKKLSTTERPTVMLFYFGIVSTVVTAVPAAYYWRTPTVLELIALFGVGALAATGQVCVIRSLTIGEATAVAPLDYTRLLFAAVIGYMFFAEVPDIWTWVGAGIVISASVYIAQREARLGRKPAPPDQA